VNKAMTKTREKSYFCCFFLGKLRVVVVVVVVVCFPSSFLSS
jgi:hypothetical protein